MNEISSSWTTVGIICAVNLPQVLATFIILAVFWSTDKTCDQAHVLRWKVWALISALRMLVYAVIVWYMQFRRPLLQEHYEVYNKWRSFRNTIDAMGLVWFVVGNMWLFGDDDNSCLNPEKSPIYDLCLSMLIFNYIQICFPCIIAIILIPIFCFCTPCLIRLLARLNDSRAVSVCFLHRYNRSFR